VVEIGLRAGTARPFSIVAGLEIVSEDLAVKEVAPPGFDIVKEALIGFLFALLVAFRWLLPAESHM